MNQVTWKVQGLFKADAQKCYEEIGDGIVTPQSVLDRAKDEDSELHKCFCWDDTEAANKYRLQQARDIIRNLVRVTPNQEIEATRVLQISSSRNEYMPTRMFLEKPDEYQILLARAKGELLAFKKRYDMIAELEEVFMAIDAI